MGGGQEGGSEGGGWLTLPAPSSVLRSSFLLLLLVGATWLLGLLAVNSDALALHYLFAVSSCLQVRRWRVAAGPALARSGHRRCVGSEPPPPEWPGGARDGLDQRPAGAACGTDGPHEAVGPGWPRVLGSQRGLTTHGPAAKRSPYPTRCAQSVLGRPSGPCR